jgi:CheY-like chemotaxis protein
LTANAFAEDKKRYLEAGMDDYLAKPFDRAGLEAVLNRWFVQTAGDAAA